MFNKIKAYLNKAVELYGADSIDLVTGDGKVCVMFHSRNNSFGIGDSINIDLLSDLEIVKLKKYATLLRCGICG